MVQTNSSFLLILLICSCTNCLVTENSNGAKHMSFHDFVNKDKYLCRHNPNQKCQHCTMPTLPSYKVKKYCPNHPPYPRGLCTACSPKPCTLGRQVYFVSTLCVLYCIPLHSFAFLCIPLHST